ncbi:fasciclin-like arabinogalactan protein 1 [Macadamia integrifolia]|uniref:fasciclin-like arabinogalactan protein 1 n=1 Tax=Macadamia integrifolia TaxID=60698 RepID=UPI001C4F6009|nr:fasciclin-like arabinogalactan protein 1 [Macadamia integrifolia]
MQIFPGATWTAALSLLVLFLLSSCGSTDAHNITKILAKHPEFSTFNHYLSATHLAAEINSKETITVCAVDNAAMADLLSKHLSIFSIKNVLSLHVLLDYFGAKKLHQITNGTALSATMYQATGSAPGSSGFVNITDLKGGKVGFAPEQNDGKLNAYFVKSVQEIPYNISVIQISSILPSAQAEAPTPGPSQLNLTALMSKKGCKMFADLLTTSGAISTFEDSVNGGLSIFCPTDGVLKGFMPKYKNLTSSAQTSLLLYHGVPVYQSMAMLKSNNGVMNTLATDGANKYDFDVQNNGEEVTLKTKIVTAKITGTVLDEQPVAIYTVDKVLMPKELFKGAPTPAPAPAPVADAKAPKASKGHEYASPPEPDSPDGQPAADQTAADSNGSVRFNGARSIAVFLSVWLGALLLAK